jgi:3D (Asp-Asp-Asp) domain-containing protein
MKKFSVYASLVFILSFGALLFLNTYTLGSDITDVPGVIATSMQTPIPTIAIKTTGTNDVLKNVYVTFYGFDDNDDGKGHYGNAVISNPILHKIATEDLGTYRRPSTFATDYRVFKAGTLIYIPKIHKYYLMEDTCVDCTHDILKGKKHVDLYMGGNLKLGGKPLIDCENKHTTDEKFTDAIIVNPDDKWPVDPKPLFQDGKCNEKIFPVTMRR